MWMITSTPTSTTETKMTQWILKTNTATNRRVEKLESNGVKVDTSTHEGRKIVGYCYLQLANNYWLTMTDTVNVLPHMKELREAWRRQDFKFTKQQQEEYDILLQARRERVKYFYDNDLVCKISKSAMDKLRDAEDN